MKCRACGSCDIEDEGVTNVDPEWMNEPEWKTEGKKYKDAREDAKNYDREYIYEKSMSYGDKQERWKVRMMWPVFHDLKYGPGGRKCFAGDYADCVMQSYDPANYPWRKEYVVEYWWEVNEPENSQPR